MSLARTAQAEPWVALALTLVLALAQERLESAVTSVESDPDCVSALVPLDDIIASLLVGVDRRERTVLAATVVDLTLSMVAARPISRCRRWWLTHSGRLTGSMEPIPPMLPCGQ